MYAGPWEIGFRKTEKILRGVQCRSRQVARQWLQAPGTNGIRTKGAASGNEESRTDVQSVATLHRVFTIWTERGPVTATMQPVPDSALMDRMRTGDEAALSTLYDRYSAMLFAVMMRILRDQQAAEEVLQDLFLQLWRNAGQFDAGRGSLPAWLMVIGRNRAISRLRGMRDREVLEEEEGDYANILASDQNIEDETVRAELARNVSAALEQLPVEQRQAVELAYFEGMTQSEIANRTGIPLGTVKTRMRTAMQTLRQILA
ncbi:MAG: sigma-70 family RNA polymerase sigma factor [Terracidiphilus sp.]